MAETALLHGRAGERAFLDGVGAAAAPFLRLAAGTAGVYPAWSPAPLGFRVLCGPAPLPPGTDLKPALCAQLEARCGPIAHSLWDEGRALVGSLSLLNAGCAAHANCAFRRAAGSDAVRAEVTRAVAPGTELLAPYASGYTCAAPGCATTLVWDRLRRARSSSSGMRG